MNKALLVLGLYCFTSWGLARERPNILFAISDDQSWMHTGAAGDPHIQTPAFDRIAKEGVFFKYPYCAAPSCAPSRSAILTGRNIWELEEGGILFGILKPGKFPIFTHVLEDGGYQTGSTGKTWGPGKVEGSPRPLFQKQLNRKKLAQKTPGLSSNDYAANFEDFFSQRDASKPFFFWYGASEPHQSYNKGGWQAAGKQLSQAHLPGCIPDRPETRGEFLDYAIEIEHFDRHLVLMMDVLEKAGELDHTMIVVTGDHGNPMPRSKCNLYDSGTRVPLAIRLPGKIPAGRKVEDFVSLIDLAPTFLAAAGRPVPEFMSGKSLWPILRDEKVEPRTFAVTAFERHIICRRNGFGYPMRSIRTHQYAYIRNYEPDRWPAGGPDFNSSHQGFYGDVDRGVSKDYILAHAAEPKIRPYYVRAFGRRPAEELYDMAKDPEQLNNLAADPKLGKTKQELIQTLETYLKAHDDPRMRGDTPWDTYPFTDKRIFKNPNWKNEGFPSPLK